MSKRAWPVLGIRTSVLAVKHLGRNVNIFEYDFSVASEDVDSADHRSMLLISLLASVLIRAIERYRKKMLHVFYL